MTAVHGEAKDKSRYGTSFIRSPVADGYSSQGIGNYYKFLKDGKTWNTRAMMMCLDVFCTNFNNISIKNNRHPKGAGDDIAV